jgi:hypothetical protein
MKLVPSGWRCLLHSGSQRSSVDIIPPSGHPAHAGGIIHGVGHTLALALCVASLIAHGAVRTWSNDSQVSVDDNLKDRRGSEDRHGREEAIRGCGKG